MHFYVQIGVVAAKSKKKRNAFVRMYVRMYGMYELSQCVYYYFIITLKHDRMSKLMFPFDEHTNTFIKDKMKPQTNKKRKKEFFN